MTGPRLVINHLVKIIVSLLFQELSLLFRRLLPLFDLVRRRPRSFHTLKTLLYGLLTRHHLPLHILTDNSLILRTTRLGQIQGTIGQPHPLPLRHLITQALGTNLLGGGLPHYKAIPPQMFEYDLFTQALQPIASLLYKGL